MIKQFNKLSIGSKINLSIFSILIVGMAVLVICISLVFKAKFLDQIELVLQETSLKNSIQIQSVYKELDILGKIMNEKPLTCKTMIIIRFLNSLEII